MGQQKDLRLGGPSPSRANVCAWFGKCLFQPQSPEPKQCLCSGRIDLDKEMCMALSLRRLTLSSVVLLPALLFVFTQSGNAIPAFSRQYQTSCSTCHLDFPKLNDFGKAF